MTHVQPGRARLLTPITMAVALAAALALAFIAVAAPTDAHAKKDKSAKQVKKLSKQVKKANKKIKQLQGAIDEAIDLANQAMEQGGKVGPAGPQGPAGPAGADGQNGENGQDGADGADGQSVQVTTENPGGNCPNAGYKLTSADGTDFVCNGTNGTDGSPWTAGGTLPVGSTETGVWNANTTVAASALGSGYASISFPVPLASSLGASSVHYQDNPDFSDHCQGTVAAPTADSGHLCVYSAGTFNVSNFAFTAPSGGGGADTAGTLLQFTVGGDPAVGTGTWAVTG